MKPAVRLLDLGTIDYEEALSLQRELFDGLVTRKESGEGADAGWIVVCEHPHVYTLGRSGRAENLLVNEEFLRSRGAALHRTDRGGDITYHGPGQIVCYPILDLERLGIALREYVGALEQSVIETLAAFGIEAGRSEKGTGVWVTSGGADRGGRGERGEGGARGGKDERKICAIGVRSSRFVTMHGLALNVATGLEWFENINPCGMVGGAVTSMERELGNTVPVKGVGRVLVDRLGRNLGVIYANRVQP